VRALALLEANALMFLAGVGLLPLLGIARSWRELVSRLGLAYFCGLAFVGVLAAQLALLRVSFGWIALASTAGVLLVAGGGRLWRTEPPKLLRPSAGGLLAALAVAAVLAEYARAFFVAPLDRYDAWAIWALKGHALYVLGWANPLVFASNSYHSAHLEYPIVLPSLEAIDFRAMGAFDPRLVHVQFWLLLVAAIWALWTILRDRVPPILSWASLFALVLAPSLFDQLVSAYADVPLALFFAVGVAAAARWISTQERWTLALAVLAFGAAMGTKNEGALFVLTAFLGLGLAAPKRWRALAVAAAVDVCVLVPWHVYTAIYGLKGTDFRLMDSFDSGLVSSRLHVAPIAFGALGEQMIDPRKWGLLFILFAVVLAAGFAIGLRGLPVYALTIVVGSWLGLTWIYVISRLSYSHYLDITKERVISSVVLAGAALTPLLATETWRYAREDKAESSNGAGPVRAARPRTEAIGGRERRPRRRSRVRHPSS
jgi:hypothetical protein